MQLAAASSTTKEQVMGLMAHMFLIVQLSRDLGATIDSNMTKILGSGQLQKIQSLRGVESLHIW